MVKGDQRQAGVTKQKCQDWLSLIQRRTTGDPLRGLTELTSLPILDSTTSPTLSPKVSKHDDPSETMTQAAPNQSDVDSRLRPPNPASNDTNAPLARSTSPFPATIDDKATASYVRRTLCAHHAISAGPPKSIHDLLPPLTSSNDLDLQLYAIIAVILKEFVQAWYSKITPDHAFVDEILQIIAHVTRALEQRLRTVHLEPLLFDEIPQLIDAHLTG